VKTAGDAIAALSRLRNQWSRCGLAGRADAIDRAIGCLLRQADLGEPEPEDIKSARSVMMRMREHYLKLGHRQYAGVFYRAAHLLDKDAP
jgi:hypothetical protein